MLNGSGRETTILCANCAVAASIDALMNPRMDLTSSRPLLNGDDGGGGLDLVTDDLPCTVQKTDTQRDRPRN